jgi:hypothetical protein
MAKRKFDFSKVETLKSVAGKYDPFSLPFLIKKEGQIFNGDFEVSDALPVLTGVRTGDEELRLLDYLVYRPLPPELFTWKTVPNYHPDSLDMEAWYQDLINFCFDGVIINGEYFNPFFVYWINVFVFPVPVLDADAQPTGEFEPNHAAYCTVDRYFFDYCWKAYLNCLDIMVMGSRGVGKSFCINNLLDRAYRLVEKSLSLVSSTNEDMTNEAWRKMEEINNSIEEKHPALKLKKTKAGDSAELKEAGEDMVLPDGTSAVRGHRSRLERVLYGRTPGKTRGKRPDWQFIEEFAAFPPSHMVGSLRSCMRESRGSWYVGGSIKKCTVLYAGTGGSVENDEAQEIFLNPTAHTILPVYDFKEGGAGFFIPIQLKRSGTWEKTGTPDIRKAVEETLAERTFVKNDPIAYMNLLQEFPMTIEEVFMRRGVNIFDQDKIASQRTSIAFDKDIVKPFRGFLKWRRAENGKAIGVDLDVSPMGDIEFLELPHWLQKDPNDPTKNVSIVPNLYVAGCDSIDQGIRDSSSAVNNRAGSELAMTVKKRIVDYGYFSHSSNIYVAVYHKRSKDVRDDWDNALKLAYFYNAEVNIEYTKIGIVSHFREHGFFHLLKKRPTIALQSADPNRTSNLIGTQVNTMLIDHMDNKTKVYVDDFYDQIWFEAVLQQLQDYNREERTKFDLVIAMGLTELADEDLMGIIAKPREAITQNLQPFGYYTDPQTGYKQYGVLPTAAPSKDFSKSLKDEEAQRFRDHGGVRWIDCTDPNNPQHHY